MHKKPRLVGVLIIVASCALLLAACGPEATAQVTSAPQATTAPVVEEGPVTVRFGSLEEPDRLENSFVCTTCWDLSEAIWPAWEAFGPKGEFVPRDAVTEISEDGKVFTFHLFEGTTWTDGTPFNAPHLAEFWDWIEGTSLSEWQPIWLYSESWKALDDLTFQVTTSEPIASFHGNDSTLANPLPFQVYGKMTEDDFWEYATDTPITTGPLKLVEWDRGQSMVFEAVPNYHHGQPAFDRAVFQFFTNWEGAVQALRTGEIDVIPKELPADFADQLVTDPNITIAETGPGRIMILLFNMSKEGNVHPALRDKRVREAIDYAVNRQKVIDVALLGHGIPCPLRWHCGDYRAELLNPDIGVTPYEPATAKQILDDAGYLDTDGDGVRETSDGRPLIFRLQFDMLLPATKVAAEIVSESLAAVGVKTNVEAVEEATLHHTMMAAEDYDLVVMPHALDADPATTWDWRLACWSAAEDTGMNYSNYCNEDFQAMFDRVAFTMDPEQRKQYIFELDQFIADDRPMIFLAGIDTMGAYRNDRVEMIADVYGDYYYLFGWWNIMNMKVK